jgi:hypothetical protein
MEYLYKRQFQATVYNKVKGPDVLLHNVL